TDRDSPQARSQPSDLRQDCFLWALRAQTRAGWVVLMGEDRSGARSEAGGGAGLIGRGRTAGMEMRDPAGEKAFYGRRRGKTLRASQAEALASFLPRLNLDLDRIPPRPLHSLFGSNVVDIRIEIGFGGGEHLLHRVGNEPECGFIGIEPFVNGMAKLVSAIAPAPPGNLRLYDDDATRLLDWLPPETIAGIDLLYPDPWPKKRHWKRRFIRPENLKRF